MIKRIIIVFLVLSWLIIIFCFSDSIASVSGPQSRVVFEKGLKYSFKVLNKLNLMSRTFTDKQVRELSIRYLTLFRKMCHLLIYLVLGVFVAAAFKNFTKLNFPLIIVFTIISCFIYSLTDEYHQTFVLGRGGSIVDCLIDTSGSLIGSFIYTGLHLTKEKFKAKIKAKKQLKLQKQE